MYGDLRDANVQHQSSALLSILLHNIGMSDQESVYDSLRHFLEVFQLTMKLTLLRSAPIWSSELSTTLQRLPESQGYTWLRPYSRSNV